MNIIHIILLVGVWFIVITKGISFINLRDEYIKSDKAKRSQELKTAQKAFVSSLIGAIVYTLIKIG